MQVVAEEFVRLARATLDASVRLAEEWSGAGAALGPADSAGGDTLHGPSFVAAAHRAAEAADVAVGRLVSVLQEDADDVLRVAFDVSVVDESAAHRFAGVPTLRRTGVG
ncbi:hypothetical protein [Nocardioides sp.]|uniref:hypothetical protein n=1 Tax=Nocardioides sp. TaxID=35761 RepID=UPI001A247580|nr:hypothetical protein [Nocardioides sp.]MBJ7358595.1 hypothetical protein [Nocardioides sp.]